MISPKKPIYWYQGLFLQPQHLQQLDIYNQSLLTPLKKHLTPYFWGASGVEFNIGLLKDLTIELNNGEFLFKDGTWLSLGNNAVVESRSFNVLWEKTHEPFIIYIALKRMSYKGENIDKLSQQELTQLPKSRYLLNDNQEVINDLYNQNQTAQIERLDYVLKLIWDTEVEFYPDYEIMPLAKVEYNGQHAVLSNNFTYPVLNIQDSGLLFNYLKNTTELLRSRATILANYKSLRKALDGDFQPASLPYLLALQTLARFAPLLNHYKETPAISPWELYGLLRQLLGELSLIDDSIDIIGASVSGELLIPPYDHNNLANCFRQVYVLIDEIIDRLIASMESIINFIHDGNRFNANIPVELLKESNKFYLCIRSALDSTYISSTLIDAIKIGSFEDISILIKRALSGVPITALSEPPAGISQKKDTTYFLLDHKNPAWQSIKEYANMSIYLSDLSESVEISLLVLKGGELFK